MRIHIPATGRYTYADGLVVSGEPVFTDELRDIRADFLTTHDIASPAAPTSTESDAG